VAPSVAVGLPLSARLGGSLLPQCPPPSDRSVAKKEGKGALGRGVAGGGWRDPSAKPARCKASAPRARPRRRASRPLRAWRRARRPVRVGGFGSPVIFQVVLARAVGRQTWWCHPSASCRVVELALASLGCVIKHLGVTVSQPPC